MLQWDDFKHITCRVEAATLWLWHQLRLIGSARISLRALKLRRGGSARRSSNNLDCLGITSKRLGVPTMTRPGETRTGDEPSFLDVLSQAAVQRINWRPR